MIEVEIHNFQSIIHAAIRVEGFTAVIGRSNIGKSSIVRAITCALTAPKGTDFVRHGDTCERRIKGNKKCRCKSVVRIKTANMELTWEKGDDVSQYTVSKDGAEPVVYTAIGVGSPDFLLPEFTPLKMGARDQGDVIQISPQFKPIFLLDKGAPTIADVLADVAKLDNINEAVSLVNKDRKEAKASRKVREKDLASQKAALERYEGIDKVADDAQAVEAAFTALQSRQEAVKALDRYLAEVGALKTSVAALEAATKLDLPTVTGLKTKGQIAIQVAAWVASIEAKAPTIRRLRGVDKVELPDETLLDTKHRELQRVRGWVNQLIKFKDDLGRWKKLPADIPNLGELEAKHAKLSTLVRLQGRLEQSTLAEAEIQSELEQADKDLAEVQAEFDELGVCPTCSQRLGADHQLHAAVGE